MQRERAVLAPRTLAMVLVALLLGALAGRVTAPSRRVPAPPGRAVVVVAGVPVRQSLSADGVVAAAADYAQALSRAAMQGDAALAAAQRTAFTTWALRTLGVRVREQARTVRAALQLAGAPGRGAITRHVPVGARLLRFGEGQAVVALWSVDLTASAPAQVTHAFWMTEQLTLVWERGRWRIAAARAASGPVPAGAQRQPSSAAVLYEQLQVTKAIPHAS